MERRRFTRTEAGGRLQTQQDASQAVSGGAERLGDKTSTQISTLRKEERGKRVRGGDARDGGRTEGVSYLAD